MRNYEDHTVFNPLYLFYLESSARDEWQKPDEVVRALEFNGTETVADIGAGSGYFMNVIEHRFHRHNVW